MFHLNRNNLFKKKIQMQKKKITVSKITVNKPLLLKKKPKQVVYKFTVNKAILFVNIATVPMAKSLSRDSCVSDDSSVPSIALCLKFASYCAMPISRSH